MKRVITIKIEASIFSAVVVFLIFSLSWGFFIVYFLKIPYTKSTKKRRVHSLLGLITYQVKNKRSAFECRPFLMHLDFNFVL